MKKALFFAGLAAASLAFVGCNKEADFFGSDKAFEVILNNEDTRTVNNGMQTAWVDNDLLNAFYAPAGSTTWSNNIKFTVKDAAANLATGKVEGLTEDAYDWYFLYPYSGNVVSPTGLKPDGTPAGYMTVGSAATGSQQQTGYNSMAHLAGTNLPVYGVVKDVPVSEMPVVAMKQIASVVKVNVKNMTGAAIHVMNVAVTAPVDIVGTYYLNITGTAPAFTPSGENYVSKTASLIVQEHTDLAAGATASFYIAVKPFTAEAGSDLSVKVTGSNGEQTSTKTLVADAVFAPGKIKEVNVNYDKAAVVSEYEWVKKTLDSVTEEDVFVIVGNNGADFAMANDKGTSAAPTAVSIAIQNDKLMLEPAANLQWKVIKNRSASVKFSPADKDDVFLYTLSSSNDGVRVGTNENNTFTEDQGYLKNVATSRYVGIYNSSDWRSYTSINNNIKNQTFAYYVKYATGTVTPDKTFTAELEGALDGANLEVPASTVSATIRITADADVAWTATPSDGLTLSQASGSGSATVTASFPANTSASPVNYSVLVSTENTQVANEEFELCITQLGVTTTAQAYPYQETFASNQGEFTIDNVSLGEGLTYVWRYDSTNKYMKAGAFVGGNSIPSQSWLLSPFVDMTGATAPELSFSHAVNKYFGTVSQEATVWIKEEGGSWNQLTISYPTVPEDKTFSNFETVTVDVSSYAGKKVQVGFKYVSTSEHAGTWEVKNFKLAEAAAGPVAPDFTVPETLTVEEGHSAKINVATNTDGAVSFVSADPAVATVAADGTVTGVAAGNTTVTVSAAATANFNAASATVAVTVTAAPTGDYGKVSTITSGKKYLILGGNQPYALIPPTGTAAGLLDGASVTISDGKIASDATTNAYAVTITVDSGKYSIVLPNGNYLIYSNSTTKLKGSATASDTWTVSAGTQGTFRFVSTATNTRALAYRIQNGDYGNTFGAYSTSNITGSEYFDIDLYELGAEPTVVPPAATLSSISVSGQQTAFNLGDSFTFGGTVTATYSDGSTKDVTSSARIAEPDMTTAGTKDVTVSYTEDEVTKNVTYQITITDPNPGTGGEKVLIIDGSQLTSTATSQATDKTYDGVTITFSDGAKFQTSNGENKFADKAILIGKSGKYIYNKTAIPGKITKFEVYSNLGASKKVSIGINFSESAISAYNANASNTYKATLETEDCIYDCSDKLPANARYFWYQVTNANNSQIQFRITYE